MKFIYSQDKTVIWSDGVIMEAFVTSTNGVYTVKIVKTSGVIDTVGIYNTIEEAKTELREIVFRLS